MYAVFVIAKTMHVPPSVAYRLLFPMLLPVLHLICTQSAAILDIADPFIASPSVLDLNGSRSWFVSRPQLSSISSPVRHGRHASETGGSKES